ncbi:MAG: hypothetical protein R3B94_08820 [Hyphomonas sp.]
MELLARNGQFRSEQLEMFERVLEIASPKLIVVANAKASEILKDRWQVGTVDAASGCHLHTVSEPPLFFSPECSQVRGRWTFILVSVSFGMYAGLHSQ